RTGAPAVQVTRARPAVPRPVRPDQRPLPPPPPPPPRARVPPPPADALGDLASGHGARRPVAAGNRGQTRLHAPAAFFSTVNVTIPEQELALRRPERPEVDEVGVAAQLHPQRRPRQGGEVHRHH